MDEGILLIVGGLLCVVSICVAGKGCNDSDNKVLQDAFAKGCSAVHHEHGGWEFSCPQTCLKPAQ